MINFDEYIRQRDPGKREKASSWRTAIGLQAVDGLTVSDYLQETAQRHIEGEISIEEVLNLNLLKMIMIIMKQTQFHLT